MLSERKLLSQMAPELSEDMILRLVATFHDLRHAYESGRLTYPYSLRGEFSYSSDQSLLTEPILAELINLVKHLKAFPDDSLETVIRNVFDFDVYRPETVEILADILDHHG